MPRTARIYTAATFAARLGAEDAKGHREWAGPVDPASRYGYTTDRGKKVYAHVLAWTLANGPVPPGHVVRHGCGRRLCCNVEHLACVTRRKALELAVRHEQTPPIADVAWRGGRVRRQVREGETGHDATVGGLERIDAGSGREEEEGGS